MIRILYLRDTNHVCGPGKTILNTCRTIARDRYAIVVAAPAATPARKNLFLERAQAIGAHVLPLRMGAYLDLGTLSELVRTIRREGIDIVQTHDAQTRRLGIPAAALGGATHVASLHGWIPNTAKQKASVHLDRMLIRRADHLIVMSEQMKAEVRTLGVPDERMTVLYNSIFLDDYPPIESERSAREVLGIPERAPTVAVIGRVSAEKGQLLFLEMARKVLDRRPEARFLVVGDGPAMPALRRRIEEMELENQVLLTGHLGDPRDAYAALDVLVIPSSTEGLPNVLLEAFAFSKPVVATRVGGIPEVLQDQTSGYLVDSGDAEALARRVSHLLDHAELARSMGRAGHDTVTKRFTFVERTRRLERLYDQIMEKRRP